MACLLGIYLMHFFCLYCFLLHWFSVNNPGINFCWHEYSFFLLPPVALDQAQSIDSRVVHEYLQVPDFISTFANSALETASSISSHKLDSAISLFWPITTAPIWNDDYSWKTVHDQNTVKKICQNKIQWIIVNNKFQEITVWEQTFHRLKRNIK